MSGTTGQAIVAKTKVDVKISPKWAPSVPSYHQYTRNICCPLFDETICRCIVCLVYCCACVIGPSSTLFYYSLCLVPPRLHSERLSSPRHVMIGSHTLHGVCLRPLETTLSRHQIWTGTLQKSRWWLRRKAGGRPIGTGVCITYYS